MGGGGPSVILGVMEKILSRIVNELFGAEVTPQVTRPEPEFGDFSTNIALQLAGKLGKSPREIAQAIAEALQNTGEYANVDVAGPGFINIRINDAVLLQQAQAKALPTRSGRRFVMEYSCPNAFKELHTGHLYQTILGDVLARMVERSGATVFRTSFGGDVGLHVAKCLYGMIEWLDGELPQNLERVGQDPFERTRWISERYVQGAGAYEEYETAKARITEYNERVYALHQTDDHNSPFAQIYWTTRQWSLEYFDAFYDMVKVDRMRYIPESATAEKGLQIVRQHLEKGVFKHSEGAVVFEGDPNQHLHTRVFITQKGLPTYETKDIGVIFTEKEDYNFDDRILITGNDQKEYMRVVFAAAHMIDPALQGTMAHITNGTVRFGDGKKMSSRLGNVSRALDVVTIITEKVKTLVQDETLVDAVALGAIKYQFMKYRVGGDMAFDLEESVSLQGNSGPYLQYAHARVCSILDKSSVAPSQLEGVKFTVAERTLLRKLAEAADVEIKATAELMPHHVCNYLYELAQEFNRFYESSRIIGDEREAIRLSLATLYRDTLADYLKLLGIVAPTRM